MKKILLLALPLMVMCFASCKETDNVWVTDDYGWKESWTDDSPIIQFKDPKFLNALLNVFYSDGHYPTIPVDRNGDGQISEKEAAVTTEIEELVDAGIRDMSEIKYFTSLAVLNCAGNQLTSLDVSNNTALTYLGCGNNQLTSLDVSNNTALTYLGCGNNQLTNLDLSNNKALIRLRCQGNQLTSLDLSSNTALTELWCYDNQLTNLDLRNNTSLIDLYCYSNNITSLDVSMCRDLEKLVCVEVDYSGFPNYGTVLPLESLKIYKYNMIEDKYITATEKVYGEIIEYVE